MRPLELQEDWTADLLKRYWLTAPAKQGIRYQALWLRRRGYSVSEVCTILDISADALSDWIHRAKRDGIDSLLKDSPRPGRSSKLTQDQQLIVCQWLDNDPGLTIPQLQKAILETWGIQISGVQIWHLLKRFDFCRVTEGSNKKSATKMWKRTRPIASSESQEPMARLQALHPNSLVPELQVNSYTT